MILGSQLTIALCLLVFGCLFLVIIAQLYHLLWWKNMTHANKISFLFHWNSHQLKANAAGNHRPEPTAGNPESDAVVNMELTRIQNRFLFTIKEETKEDLESDDGRSRIKSLSDLIMAVDSPVSLDYCSCHGFNPLFEASAMEGEVSRLRASPPPKLKFLRDAEEKLHRRLLEEAEKIERTGIGGRENGGFWSSRIKEEDGRDGPMARAISEMKMEKDPMS